MVIAAIGTVFAAAYLLWLYQRTAFGNARSGHGADQHDEDLHDVNTYEWLAWTPLLVAIVLFGIVPNLLFSVIDPAVEGALRAFGG
jgi:NADH-quinone oxidoreductase subunit M